MATERQWGVTPAFSNEPPSAAEIKLSDALTAELKSQDNFPPTSDTERREAVIAKFKTLLRQMVQTVGKKKGLPQELLKDAGGEVYTYGSYRLGVYGPNSDVDTLMVAPKHVTRENFFELMPELLKATGEASEIVPVPGIGTPIIKLDFQGVDIDLIFCSLQLSAIPEKLDLADDSLLRGLDDVDVRCVNGTRVTNRILQLVPQTKTFRVALRAIKLWAQRRAIYGNNVGFPGGVAYAILVARVCQLYPKAVAPLLISKFFFIMKRWNWPKPVFLTNKEPTSLQLREWDPNTYRGDQLHKMPILTPMVPSQNTAHTVGKSTMAVMMQELERGEKLTQEILLQGKPWSTLFTRHGFFTEAYKHYICVTTASKSKEAQEKWTGLVNSKIRWLVSGIEGSDAKSVELVQPYIKGFARVHECKGQDQVDKTLEGSLEFQVKEIKTETVDQSADVKMQVATQAAEAGVEAPALNGETKKEEETDEKDGVQKVYSTTYYLGIGLLKGATNLDISKPVKTFQDECQAWANYDADVHSIRIKHIRNFDLPNDVFEDGETKPTRLKKKVKTAAQTPNTAAVAPTKRSFTDTGLNDNAVAAKRRQSGNSSQINGTPNGTAG